MVINYSKVSLTINIKVKFNLITPAEKEFEIIDEKMWLENKNDFVELIKKSI